MISLKNFLSSGPSYRLQQLLILIAHLLLLWWMIWLLEEGGTLKMTEVIIHFCGMALYGAILIRLCAAWGKWLVKK
ncbi:MAG: hypothetical protein H6622_07275 [Halobacteriovoraceae bacterium]|nr:hypothetical protein [Halobacteriovoraceae bacterium]